MTEEKIKIAMLLDNNGEYDNRVYLEARTLASQYDLTLFTGKAAHLPASEEKDGIKIRRMFNPDDFRYANRKKLLEYAGYFIEQGFTIIHCHDYLMLEVGAEIKKRDKSVKLIYDSHEVFHSWPVSTAGSSFINKIKSLVVWQLRLRAEKKNTEEVDCLITVNSSVAKILERYFKLKSKAQVIRTIPYYQQFSTGQNLLRNNLKISTDSKILVFIGMKIFAKTLNIEKVIDEIGNKPGISIVFIGGDDPNKEFFKDYVVQHHYTNIYFHPLIPTQQIPSYLCDCNVGLVPTWNKKDLSYWYALDNKLFNYISAGIPVLATAQPEYKTLVEEYNIGVCVNPDESSTAYYDGMEKILGSYTSYKENAMKARELLNWENESKKLLELYQQLVPAR